MRRFLIKILVFFAIAFIADFAVGKIVVNLQAKSKGGTTQKDYFIQNTLESDVIIMGSSRASHHLIPKQIEDSFKMTVYNAGMDGKGIILNYGLLIEITRRYKPRAIIYEITPWYDYIEGDNDQYLPHLRCAYNITGVDSIFWKVNPSERYKMKSNLYRVNSLVPHLIYDNILAKPDTFKGYSPLFGIYKLNDISLDDISYEGKQPSQTSKIDIDSLKVGYLRKFVSRCEYENIKLIFSISPTYKSDMSIYDYGIKFAQDNHIPIIDYRDAEIMFQDSELFQDKHHLNYKGASIYTRYFIEKLRYYDEL